MYANVGRPSIPPERLLKSSLLIALYSVRSERAFCEQLDYNLLFRWFLDMNLIEPSFDATTFTKNRERLLRHGVGHEADAGVRQWISDTRRRPLVLVFLQKSSLRRAAKCYVTALRVGVPSPCPAIVVPDASDPWGLVIFEVLERITQV